MRKPGGAARRALDPFNVSRETADPVADELDRLGVTLSVPSPRTNVGDGPPLSRREQTEIRARRGQAVRAGSKR